MAHNIRQKEKNKSQSNMIRSCLSSFMHKRRLFVLYACDLQFAPKTSNEGLEILYTKPNLFDLSLSQSAWWGKELVGNFHNYTVLLKNCATLFLSLN